MIIKEEHLRICVRSTDQRNAPTASGIASNRKVFVRPNLSAKEPPVNEPTVAPARSVLTTQPTQCTIA